MQLVEDLIVVSAGGDDRYGLWIVVELLPARAIAAAARSARVAPDGRAVDSTVMSGDSRPARDGRNPALEPRRGDRTQGKQHVITRRRGLRTIRRSHGDARRGFGNYVELNQSLIGIE